MVDDTQEMVFYPEDIKRIEEMSETSKRIKEIFDKKHITTDDYIFIIRCMNSMTQFELECLCNYFTDCIYKHTDSLKNISNMKSACEKLLQLSNNDTTYKIPKKTKHFYKIANSIKDI